MKIFISTSGTRSKRIGQRLYDFLKAFLHYSEPFFSDENITKGTRWFQVVSAELEQAKFGIICLTKENRANPWILFESGALAKNLKESNVCPILFGLETADVEGPLAHFQLTLFERAEMFNLCWQLNLRLAKQLDNKTFERLFDTLWIQTENEISGIINDDQPDLKVSGRTNREILEEIWHGVRDIRYTEMIALNDQFIKRLVDALDSYVQQLAESAVVNSPMASIRDLLEPVEYFISQVRDRTIRTKLIEEYEGLKHKCMDGVS
jgi:hypothetical protein